MKPFTFPNQVAEGEPVSVTCAARTNQEVGFHWFKNDQPLKEEKPRLGVFTLGGISTLMINRAKLSDEGTYKCEAQTDSNSASENAILNISSKPLFLVEPKNVSITDGQSEITIDCIALSKPQPEIKWAMNSDEGKAIAIASMILMCFFVRVKHERIYGNPLKWFNYCEAEKH